MLSIWIECVNINHKSTKYWMGKIGWRIAKESKCHKGFWHLQTSDRWEWFAHLCIYGCGIWVFACNPILALQSMKQSTNTKYSLTSNIIGWRMCTLTWLIKGASHVRVTATITAANPNLTIIQCLCEVCCRWRFWGWMPQEDFPKGSLSSNPFVITLHSTISAISSTPTSIQSCLQTSQDVVLPSQWIQTSLFLDSKTHITKIAIVVNSKV